MVPLLIASSALGLWVAQLMRGRNYSDVGVAMYTHGGRGLACALVSFVGLVTLGLLGSSWAFRPGPIAYLLASWLIALFLFADVALFLWVCSF